MRYNKGERILCRFAFIGVSPLADPRQPRGFCYVVDFCAVIRDIMVSCHSWHKHLASRRSRPRGGSVRGAIFIRESKGKQDGRIKGEIYPDRGR